MMMMMMMMMMMFKIAGGVLPSRVHETTDQRALFSAFLDDR